MSRSYKKFPISKDGNRKKKQIKQIANRKYRRKMKQDLQRQMDESSNPRAKKYYRKNFESWDIADYVSYWPLSAVIDSYSREMREYELTGVVPYFVWRHPEIKDLDDYINFYYKRGPQYRK